MEKLGTAASRSLALQGSQQNSGSRSNNALAIRRNSASMPAIRNPETDIAFPLRLWEAWIEPGKPRRLRRPLRDDERAMLEARRAELEPWIVGYHAEERDGAALALFEMFSGFRSMTGSDEKIAATVDGMLRVLDRFPLWAIERACRQIRERGYTRRDGDRYITERHWPPSDAEMIEAVEAQVRLYRDQHDSAIALLNAKVAT